jgi:hypothetical protein
MGNAHGNHFGEGEYTDEWKGPLSDEVCIIYTRVSTKYSYLLHMHRNSML